MNNNVIEREINSEYARMAEQRKEILNERRVTVYALIPEIEDIDNQIATVGIRYSAKIINEKIPASELAAAMEKELNELKSLRAKILAKHNMDENVFEVPYECEACKDTGEVNGEKCLCYKNKVKAFMKDAASRISNMSVNFENVTFHDADFSFYSKEENENFGVSPYDNARNIYRTCLNYCKNFGKKYENLYIYGPAGVGKSFLTSCMVSELLNNGHGVIYQTAYKLFGFLEDCHFKRSNCEDNDILLKAIYDCDLLIIDDFGTEFINSYTQSVLFDLLNTRLSGKKPTIINSNLNINDVRSLYSDRISSRIMGEFTLLRFMGEDIRLLKKERGN